MLVWRPDEGMVRAKGTASGVLTIGGDAEAPYPGPMARRIAAWIGTPDTLIVPSPVDSASRYTARGYLVFPTMVASMPQANVVDPLTGEPAEYLLTAGDNRGLPGAFEYYRGPTGHVFLNEVPESLGDHYADGYQPIPHTEAQLAEMAKKDAYRLDIVKQFVSAGDFLEIGPWIGLVSYTARQAGYRTHVLEMDQRCVDLLDSVGVDATRTNDPAKTLREMGKTYDVIGLWHSIEHLPRPWEVIDEATKALNPGGLLVVAAPNPLAWQFERFRERWYHLDAPRHLHLLTSKDIEAIGLRNGLVTVENTTDDALGRELDSSGMNFELAKTYRPGSLFWRVAWRLLRRKADPNRRAGFRLAMQRPR